MELRMLEFVLLLCLVAICYPESVKGSGIVELRYAYVSVYGSNCIVSFVGDKEKGTVKHQHSCQKKTSEAGVVDEGKTKELPMQASEYLKKKVTTWRIPPITKFIDMHTKEADGKTVEQYVYISDNDKNCTVTVVRDNKSKLMTDRTWLCVKVEKLTDRLGDFPSTHSIVVKSEQVQEEEKGMVSMILDVMKKVFCFIG